LSKAFFCTMDEDMPDLNVGLAPKSAEANDGLTELDDLENMLEDAFEDELAMDQPAPQGRELLVAGL
jgi:hypothetical protein